MKKQKLWLAAILTLAMVALTGCGNSENAEPTPTAIPTATEAPAVPTEAVSTADPDVIPEKYEHFSENGIATWDNGYMRKDLTSLELVTLMGNGTNLGNTMEAYGRATLGVGADVSQYETFWGQPVTTQEMISELKASGFNSLRIPIAWTNAMNFESGDYTINSDYLDRVEEIINYALNEDMYVVINDHWDGGWWGKFGSATESTREAAMEQFVSMWTQIANRYKEYSDYLIFEAANEELGNRLNDLDLCPDSGSLSVDECYEMVLKINQTFVDTIRSTGGNNEHRFLLIPGYNTDITMTCDERFIMPTDTAENKLLVSVHYYEPFGYCGAASLSTWGLPKDYITMNTYLTELTLFTEMGYGVVIGEYHVALNLDGSVKANTCDFINNFLDNCDLYGYCPMFWDCSTHFIRKDLKYLDQAVGDLFAGRSLSAQADLTEEEIQDNAKAAIKASLEAARLAAEEAPALSADQAKAWLMYNSSDWNTLYSSGDTYSPESITLGTVATDVDITGAGTYTVGLDFTGTNGGYANSVVFSAIGIANGERIFPGCTIELKELLVNGEPYTLTGKPYTASDDGKCTRMNLFNDWVTTIPDDARSYDGDITGIQPTVIDAATLGNVETIYVTFELHLAE